MEKFTLQVISTLVKGHDREFIWKVRGFSSVEEMNKTIIENFNNIISPEDEVYILGDLTLGDLNTGMDCLRQLNGKLHIVLGNHDTDRRIVAYKTLPNVVEITYATMLHYKKYHFYMSHYPTMTGNLEKESLRQMTLNLYGHTHQVTNFYQDIPFMYHVGVDSHNCTPVLIDDIIREMYEKVDECKEYLDQKIVEFSNPQGHTVIAQEQQAAKEFESAVAKCQTANKEKIITNCNHCFFQAVHTCHGPMWGNCPPGITYKRDPPDGGYYG